MTTIRSAPPGATRSSSPGRGLKIPVPSRAAERPWRFVLFWTLCWAGVGLSVGVAIVWFYSSTEGDGFALRTLVGSRIPRLSVLFAEVVGLTALSSSRWIFPYYKTLPYLPRVLLQIVTLVGGALFGTIVAVASYPLFALHEWRPILVVSLINAVLALVVGIAVDTYETMKGQIEKSYIELRKSETFEREMEIAREVQEQLFPKSVPKVRGLELAGLCLPAAGVGGDYYDYLPLSDDRVGLVIADVSGKGISAALLMASLQASVRNVLGPEATPSSVNRRLNEILYRSTTASRYATLFLGLFDASDRTLRYSNAGHNPAMIVRSTETTKLTEGGLPLGILDASDYSEGSQVLEVGDLLLLYTDGAVEAADPSGREFGLDRLVDLFQAGARSHDLGSLIHTTVTALQDWTHGSPQQDDITLVIARAVA